MALLCKMVTLYVHVSIRALTDGARSVECFANVTIYPIDCGYRVASHFNRQEHDVTLCA
jgi:hypothetical protein